MEVKEIIKIKEELESKIEKLLNEFQKETETNVESIDWYHMYNSSSSGQIITNLRLKILISGLNK